MKRADPNDRAMTRREYDKARKSDKENLARLTYDPWFDPFEVEDNSWKWRKKNG